MSPAHVLEPTYRRLKRAVLDGKWRGGAKLEAQRLADEYGVSMTPVRDSLNQLVGEGLVDLKPGEGFRVAPLSEKVLRDMLDVNLALLELANPAGSMLPGEASRIEPDADYADRVAGLFSNLAARSGNAFLRGLVTHVSDRLHAIRQFEPEFIPAALETIEGIEASLTGSASDRRAALARYHRECCAVIPQLVARANR